MWQKVYQRIGSMPKALIALLLMRVRVVMRGEVDAFEG